MTDAEKKITLGPGAKDDAMAAKESKAEEKTASPAAADLPEEKK